MQLRASLHSKCAVRYSSSYSLQRPSSSGRCGCKPSIRCVSRHHQPSARQTHQTALKYQSRGAQASERKLACMPYHSTYILLRSWLGCATSQIKAFSADVACAVSVSSVQRQQVCTCELVELNGTLPETCWSARNVFR